MIFGCLTVRSFPPEKRVRVLEVLHSLCPPTLGVPYDHNVTINYDLQDPGEAAKFGRDIARLIEAGATVVLEAGQEDLESW